MAYRRSYDGMRLLSAWNIIINLVLSFVFSNGEMLRDCRFDKNSLGGKKSIRSRSYIPETNFVSWALLD